MPRLALAVGSGAELGSGAVTLLLDRRTAAAAFRQLGATVLLYTLVPDTLLLFVGRGRVAGLEAGERGQAYCRIDASHRFDAPLNGEEEVHIPGARRMLALSEARFGELYDAGAASANAPMVAEEAAAAFEHQRGADLSIYRAVHDEVLRRWGYRCAVTGQQFAPSEGLHPALRVVAIRPRELGGPLHAANYLPMVEMAERAWRGGTIAVNAKLELLAVLDRLPAELLEAMPGDGHLVVPEAAALRPDPEHLAFHRIHIFAA